MPMYEYQCGQCGRRTEKRQKFSDAPLTECPYCGGPLTKLISAPAVQFKGGGWYADGYGSKKPVASASGEGGSTASGEGGAPGSKSDASGNSDAATGSSAAAAESGSARAASSSDSSSSSTASSTASSGASSSAGASDK